ncbi:hypothetical protein V6N13_046336 [Hibiscus sabdariffa]
MSDCCIVAVYAPSDVSVRNAAERAGCSSTPSGMDEFAASIDDADSANGLADVLAKEGVSRDLLFVDGFGIG